MPGTPDSRALSVSCRTLLQVFELGFETAYIVLLVFAVGSARCTDMEGENYLRILLTNNPPSLVMT